MQVAERVDSYGASYFRERLGDNSDDVRYWVENEDYSLREAERTAR